MGYEKFKKCKKSFSNVSYVSGYIYNNKCICRRCWADLSGTLNTPINTTNTNTSSGNTLGNTSNTSNTSNTLNTTLNTATNNKVNTSSYNSTNLPDTGIEDSLPAVALIVVVGISAAYAYKKVKDYQNI